MKNVPSLKILVGVRAWIMTRARKAGRNECMGLLAARSNSSVIKAACWLPAEASGSHAVAAPLTIKEAVTKLIARGYRPAGLWHSHSNHPTYHSNTDNDTTERLCHGMAELNWRSPRLSVQVPIVTGPDRAVLPLPDGQALHFLLIGRKLPDLEAHERAAWGKTAIAFHQDQNDPHAQLRPHVLKLQSAGVELRLGIPDGVTVTCQKKDWACMRTAQLYSLVVNNMGDSYAEVMMVRDLNGEVIFHRGQCGIEVIENASEAPVKSVVIYKENAEVANHGQHNHIPLAVADD